MRNLGALVHMNRLISWHLHSIQGQFIYEWSPCAAIQFEILTKTPYNLPITPCQGLTRWFKSLLLLKLVPEYIFDMTNIGAADEVLINLELQPSPSSVAVM